MKRWNYTFTGLNVGLGALALLSASYNIFTYFSVAFALILLLTWILSKSKGGEIYKNSTKDGWIEAEMGIYSSFAVWIGVYLIFIIGDHENRTLEFLVSGIVFVGIFGWIVSLLPLTNIVEKLR